MTSRVRALSKGEPKSINVRWEGVVNQNSGNHRLWGTAEEEMIRRLRRATGEAERPGGQEAQKSREGTIQGRQHAGPQNPRVCGG